MMVRPSRCRSGRGVVRASHWTLRPSRREGFQTVWMLNSSHSAHLTPARWQRPHQAAGTVQGPGRRSSFGGQTHLLVHHLHSRPLPEVLAESRGAGEGGRVMSVLSCADVFRVVPRATRPRQPVDGPMTKAGRAAPARGKVPAGYADGNRDLVHMHKVVKQSYGRGPHCPSRRWKVLSGSMTSLPCILTDHPQQRPGCSLYNSHHLHTKSSSRQSHWSRTKSVV